MWLMTNHVGLYTLTCVVLVTTLPTISFYFAFLYPGLRLGFIVATVGGVVTFSIWTGHKVSIRSVYLLKDLTLKMVELGSMTEYDSKDYEGDVHKTAIAGTMICIWGGLVCGMNGLAFPVFTTYIFLFSIIPSGLVAVYFMFSALSRAIDLYVCFEDEEEDEEYMDEEEYDPFIEYEDNEYLQAEFSEVIERLKLKDSLISKHAEKYEKIRAGFSKTEYPNCRWTNDYVENDTLHIICRDVSVAAARRYGTAILVKGSLRFFTELSLKRRAIYLFAFFFGLIMLMPVMIAPFQGSIEFTIGVTILTGVVFSGMWNIGRKQNEEMRRELTMKLRKTGVFNDYEFEFYNKMLSLSSRFDWAFLIGYLLILLVTAFVCSLWAGIL